MRRLLLLAAAVLVVCVVFWAPEVQDSSDVVSALGRSLGGGRVALVDVLFVRAERLRQEGRYEELPGLYAAIQRLDPENTAAADHLAGIYAYDVLREAPDDAARFGWWLEAWELLESALAAHPDDPSLLMRSTDLLLDVAPRHPGLEDAIAERVGDPRRLGVARLLKAAHLTHVLPRRGRTHLLRLVILLPIVAAQALEARQEDWRALVVAGRQVAERRRETLAQMHLPSEEAGSGPPMDTVFAARLEAVAAVGEALRQDDRAAGDAAIRRYEELDPGSALGGALRRALAAR